MSFGEKGLPYIIVKGGEYDGEIVHVDTEPSTNRKKIKREIDVDDGVFRPFPNKTTRVYYISGPSGSGKSTCSAEYIKLYRKIHPNAKIIVFSCLSKDPAIDSIKNITRVVLKEDYIEEPIEIEEIVELGKHVLLLFDDCDTITDKNLLKSINLTKTKVMELGRHFDIQIVITSHLANGNDRSITRTVMNEMGLWTFFPGSGSWYQNSYALKNYFGFSPKQISRLKELDTRAATITKQYPQILVTDHFCCFVSDF